jgi:hypothetical protein
MLRVLSLDSNKIGERDQRYLYANAYHKPEPCSTQELVNIGRNRIHKRKRP